MCNAICSIIKFVLLGVIRTLLGIQYLVIHHHCNLSKASFESMSFRNLVKNCTTVPRANYLTLLEDSELMSARLNDKIKDIVANLTRNNVTSNQYSYLNFRQMLALYKVSPYHPNIFLTKLKDIIQLKKINTSSLNYTNNYTDYKNETIKTLLMESTKINMKMISSSLNGWIGDVHHNKIFSVTPVSRIAIKLNISIGMVLSMNIRDIVSLFRSVQNLRFGLWQHVCKDAKSDVDFDDLRHKCIVFKNAKKVELVEKFTPDDVKVILAGKYDIKMINYISMLIITKYTYLSTIDKSRTPLIILAHKKNIKLTKLVEDDLVTTTISVLQLPSSSILVKIFKIPDSIMALAHNFALSLLHTQEDYIDNVKQIYTGSLKVTLEVISKHLKGYDAKHKELPKFIRMISEMKFKVLVGLYNKGNYFEFLQSGNLVDLAEELFGINAEFFKFTFNLSTEKFDLLKRRTFTQMLVIRSWLKSADIPDQSPAGLSRMVLGFSTHQMQDFLFSSPKDIVKKSVKAYGIVKDMLVDNRYNVTSSNVNAFIHKYFDGFNGFNASVISQKFLNMNLTNLAKKMKSSVEVIASTAFHQLIKDVAWGESLIQYYIFQLRE